MKTQLLQDLNDSGSANAKPPIPEPKGPPDTARERDAAVQPELPAAEAVTPATLATPADTPAAQPVLATPAAEPDLSPAEAPAVAPAASPVRPGPAVWQRPRPVQADAPAPSVEAQAQAQAQALAPAPEPVRKIEPRPATPLREVRADHHVTVQPKGFAPQPLPFGTTVPNYDGMTTTDRDPDWLAERLARDAALHERPEWNGSWARRLASWGAAGVLLALVAAGGLWLYEQRQVEGALAVLASTNPPPAAGITQPVTRPLAQPVQQPVAPSALPTPPANAGLAATAGPPATAPAMAPAAAPALAPPAQNVPAPAPSMDAVGQSATASTAAAAGDTASSPTVEAPSVKAVDTAADAKRAGVATSSRSKVRSERSARVSDEQANSTPAKRKQASARKQTKTVASAAGRDGARDGAREGARTGERSYRQRYDETLMQCRAHGYDERQCLQRGCEMTRFGFACKG
jgi:hypothetical protein